VYKQQLVSITEMRFIEKVTISNVRSLHTRVYPKVSGLSHKEINKNNNKHSLRSDTKGHSGKTH